MDSQDSSSAFSNEAPPGYEPFLQQYPATLSVQAWCSIAATAALGVAHLAHAGSVLYRVSALQDLDLAAVQQADGLVVGLNFVKFALLAAWGVAAVLWFRATRARLNVYAGEGWRQRVHEVIRRDPAAWMSYQKWKRTDAIYIPVAIVSWTVGTSRGNGSISALIDADRRSTIVFLGFTCYFIVLTIYKYRAIKAVESTRFADMDPVLTREPVGDQSWIGWGTRK